MTAPPGSPLGGAPEVGLAGEVDFRRAPVPEGDTEALLFATLHPPLIRLDCRGRLAPGVVDRWDSADGGRSWVLRVAGGATDDAGASARVAAVVGRLADPAAWPVGTAPAAVELRPPAEIRVTFRDPLPDGAATFAVPALSPVPQGPIGPGTPLAAGFDGHSLERDATAAAPGGATLLLRDHGGQARVRIRVEPRGDPRALLDRGALLVLTRDPGAIAWAHARGGDVQVQTLPPDRLHLLALPGGDALPLSSGVTERLASDVVPGGGRVSAPWVLGGGCPEGGAADGPGPGASRAAPAAGTTGRVVHLAGDEVARALAERVVALAGPGGDAQLRALSEGAGGALQAVGLSAAEYSVAVREGRDAAYLILLPRSPAAPCQARADLVRRVPWLTAGGLHPLAETGQTALLRPGAPSLEVDGSGAVRLLPGGRP